MQATREMGLDPRWEALPPPVELIADVIGLAVRFGCSPAEAFFAGIMDLTEISAKSAQGSPTRYHLLPFKIRSAACLGVPWAGPLVHWLRMHLLGAVLFSSLHMAGML